MPNFVQRHQSQLYLLPPDLRDWLLRTIWRTS